MNAATQMQLILQTIEEAQAQGKTLSIVEAQRKLHREYITRQLWNRYGVTMKGFLVLANLTQGEYNNLKEADTKIYGVFNRYLNAENKLTGDTGRLLRKAMSKLEIDYLNSPTYPLERLAV